MLATPAVAGPRPTCFKVDLLQTQTFIMGHTNFPTHGPLLSHLLQSWCDPVTAAAHLLLWPTYCRGPPTDVAHLVQARWATYFHGPLSADYDTWATPVPPSAKLVRPSYWCGPHTVVAHLLPWPTYSCGPTTAVAHLLLWLT